MRFTAQPDKDLQVKVIEFTCDEMLVERLDKSTWHIYDPELVKALEAGELIASTSILTILEEFIIKLLKEGGAESDALAEHKLLMDKELRQEMAKRYIRTIVPEL